jgi:hypothetical protein
MLIKLAGGVKAKPGDLKAEIGALFHRYMRCGAYDKGEVVEIKGERIVVDFLDSVREFNLSIITLVYGGGSEYLMCCDEGTVLKDYRSRQMIPPQDYSLEDLLDFDKWMV